MRLVIAIIVGVVAFVGEVSAEQAAPMLRLTYPTSPDYGLVVYVAASLDSTEAMYYIARWTNRKWPPYYIKLDSIRAVYANSTDTNMFVFICADFKTYHLVAVKTSPTIQFDTIMTQGIDPPDNWLAYPESVEILTSHNIVAGSFGRRSKPSLYEIRRINNDGSTLLIHAIDDVKDMSVSVDRSELYFEIMPPWERNPVYYVRAYDVEADTFYVVGDSNNSARGPTRSTKSSPLYYVSQDGVQQELWRMLPNGSHERVIRLKRTEAILNFVETLDSLGVTIHNFIIDTTYMMYFVH